jgi:hypothetical protein
LVASLTSIERLGNFLSREFYKRIQSDARSWQDLAMPLLEKYLVRAFSDVEGIGSYTSRIISVSISFRVVHLLRRGRPPIPAPLSARTVGSNSTAVSGCMWRSVPTAKDSHARVWIFRVFFFEKTPVSDGASLEIGPGRRR